MEDHVRLYTLNYQEAKTYFWVLTFVVCNMVLPQLFHLIPNGGVIFAPLSAVILMGSYKFGWKVGTLSALLSPMVNHFIFGMPSTDMVLIMTAKLLVIALVASWAAHRFQSKNIRLLISVVLLSTLLGGCAEWMLTHQISATIADFTIGWPGFLLQVVTTSLFVRLVR